MNSQKQLKCRVSMHFHSVVVCAMQLFYACKNIRDQPAMGQNRDLQSTPNCRTPSYIFSIFLSFLKSNAKLQIYTVFHCFLLWAGGTYYFF